MKDLHDRLADAGVHTLMVQFTDLQGVARGKLVPLRHLDEVLASGVAFNAASVGGLGLPRTGPRSDYVARGIASTAVALPWMPGVARIVGEGFVDGHPFDACPRQVLARQVARLAERRWSLQVGVESEFYLLERAGERWQPDSLHERAAWRHGYNLESLPRHLPFLHGLQVALEACGLDLAQIDPRDAPGQYQLSFAHADVLASADRLMLFRLGAQALASTHGLAFSPLPKPFEDLPGSGMHCHVSLWEGVRNDVHNVFTPHRPDGSLDGSVPLSPIGLAFIGGVLAHSAALTALAAPTVCSYRRLRADAAVHITHGFNNRTALVRTLHGRFEWRASDASANPYLVLAGLIAAGLDGIDRGLDAGPGCDDDLFAASAQQLREHRIERVAGSLPEALDALEADAVIGAALGSTLTREFCAAKRAEAAA